MKKIIFACSTDGNGGIESWAKNYVRMYRSSDFELINIDLKSKRQKKDASIIRRVYEGLIDLFHLYIAIRKEIRINKIVAIHKPTSGSLGTLSDYVIGRLCQRNHIKTIMHCHYGCVSDDYKANSLVGWLLRKTMGLYDQIWVLDKKSEQTLKSSQLINGEVLLTPNFIDIKNTVDLRPKEYDRIAFVGNLIPDKGLLELVEAAKITGVRLDIIGPGLDWVVEKIKEIAGECLNKKIYIHGRLSNEDAVKFMKSIDILALPTYYQSEAFPISILEAMSLSKLVISTNRAAIPDMLTGNNGEQCGLLVKERNVSDIVNSINWCRDNKEKADEICKNAYLKVSQNYNKDNIFNLYNENYLRLFK